VFVKVHDVLECFWVPSAVWQGCVRVFDSVVLRTKKLSQLSQAQDGMPSNMLLWLRGMKGVLWW